MSIFVNQIRCKCFAELLKGLGLLFAIEIQQISAHPILMFFYDCDLIDLLLDENTLAIGRKFHEIRFL